MKVINEQEIFPRQICANCGHYFFLHENNFGKKECQACDDPTIPIEKKCPEFKQKEIKWTL